MKEKVVIQKCRPETDRSDVVDAVYEMLKSAAVDTAKLGSAKKVLIKPNLGIANIPVFKGRYTTVVDTDVFEGVCRFLSENTDAEILYGDGMTHTDIRDAMKDRGYSDIAEKYNMRLVDLNKGPYASFRVEEPAMFSRYELSAELEDVDFFVSVAKMKSHHLCGVTLTQKNLFGIPPCPIYGEPRIALHSSVRLPYLLVDLARLFPLDLCVVDGIIGGNFSEWQGDPISSGLLIAGTNHVAVDATAARLMHVDPAARMGTAPFIRTHNHILLASEHGLGPVAESDIDVEGEVPDMTLPYSNISSAVADTLETAADNYRGHCENANRYFDKRDEFIEQYNGETIIYDGKDVIMHDGFIADFREALSGQVFKLYELFCKLVEKDDPELREPYRITA